MFVKPSVYGIALSFFLLSSPLAAQTLFSYGPNKVSKEEFLKAYHKNNNDTAQQKISYADYLELYYRYKLKVRAALDARMDTLSSQKVELQGFREQLADYYITQDAGMQIMIDEAFERSLKDIHLLSIFIPLSKNPDAEETKAAEAAIRAAYQELRQGKPFTAVALQYNPQQADPNEGDLGFVSAFTLPYELETLAYSTPPGAYSAPFRGKNGWHILMNKEERKAMGKLRIAQIQLAFPPGISEEGKMLVAKRADSIYSALQAGAAFAQLAEQFSDDNLTYRNGGEMPAFEAGYYDPVFEAAAFDLEKDGEISKPVKTAFGYHILKRIQRISVIEDKNDKQQREALKERIQQSDRMQAVQQMLIKDIQSRTGYAKAPVDENKLSILTDSIIQQRPLPEFPDLNPQTVLLTIGGETRTATDFRNYLEEKRSIGEELRDKTYAQLFDGFAEKTTIDYYRDHLEKYNRHFADQLAEFTAGNLLFEIMQQQVWDPSLTDSASLEKYYTDHKDNYWWEQSADALIFICPDKETAEKLRAALQEDHTQWRALAASLGDNIQVDSGRFNLGQIPAPEGTHFTGGLITTPVGQQPDNTAAFSYIIKLYSEKEPKSFADARGEVIVDYQNRLEEQWIEGLKKQYPLKVNKKQFKKLRKDQPIL